MKTLLRFLAKHLSSLPYGGVVPREPEAMCMVPMELREGEPYLVLSASDALAPSAIEHLAQMRWRYQSNYGDYQALTALAGRMRQWSAEHTEITI